MLKTISAALLAASVIAAPAFAAEAGKTTTQTPVIKADQTQIKAPAAATKSEVKTDAKVDAGKTSAVKTDTKAMNANAAIMPSEHHKSVRSHRHHGKVLSSKKTPEVGKPAAPVTTEKRS